MVVTAHYEKVVHLKAVKTMFLKGVEVMDSRLKALVDEMHILRRRIQNLSQMKNKKASDVMSLRFLEYKLEEATREFVNYSLVNASIEDLAELS